MPRKRSKKQKAIAKETTATENGIVPLTDNKDNAKDNSDPKKALPKNEIKTKAPTPIVMPKDELKLKYEYKEFMNFLEEFKKKHSTTKVLTHDSDKNIQIKIYNKNVKNIFIKELEEKDIAYHTYSEPKEKTHAFVLRGLDNKSEISDIKAALEKLNVNTKEIYKMRSSYNTLYLVITDRTHTLDTMQNIKVLLDTNIQWKRHVNKKIIMQCHNCQIWGHAASNCHRKPRCLKCGEDHHTKQCTKLSNTPAKCANCKSDHPANYSKCPVYLSRIEMGGRPRKPRLLGILPMNLITSLTA